MSTANSKTRKTVAKRFKLTATGKIKRAQACRRHLLECKSAKRKRRLARGIMVHSSDVSRIKQSLPFS
ncbi:50S ribosomal protein L35 [Candidatus Xiphinematobacter sp. Idaho Grape]|uniref:50S ribosomal protein L35 n=1 Tax=Candidatus Xiphinematobacter sp. Idaho Grape TaxID=1704307 RepID=UPI000705EC60|nr:50S ribosomal protein L35 [Candidatus Xiphinematobacter sp. Idaho Grape]ALJ57020.1 50S ribosomal protein L35 [Candidatus Xiphinematobacter sp. Idaho Grape]